MADGAARTDVPVEGAVDGTTEDDGVRRIAGVLRTPGDLRPRRPLGDGVRAARTFAFDVARPRGGRTEGGPLAPGLLPAGVLPSGRGIAPEQPAMPQTGALAAYAALLARKVKPPRDVPVRGLPLVVRRTAHAEDVRLPGGIVAALTPEDAKVAPNAARAPRRVQRPSTPQPSPQPAPAPGAAPSAARAAVPQRGPAPRPAPSRERANPTR